jgi:hypothetical protein
MWGAHDRRKKGGGGRKCTRGYTRHIGEAHDKNRLIRGAHMAKERCARGARV